MSAQPLTRQISFCRLCLSTKLTVVLDLGMHALATFPSVPGEGIKAPIKVLLCKECGLAQLAHTVDRDAMYQRYWYRSSTTSTMSAALHDIVKSINQVIRLEIGDKVLDIGSNDGHLLSWYSPLLEPHGIDPSAIVDEGYFFPCYIHKGYFSYEMLKDYAPFKVITSVAMLYDVDNPLAFMADVASLLHPNGIWVNQMNHLPLVLANSAVDFFSHEHLTLWSFETFKYALDRAGLEAFMVQTMPLNGGTFRVFAQHKGGPFTPSTPPVIPETAGPEEWKLFRARLAIMRAFLHNFLKAKRLLGERMFAYGAGTRGNSLLQALDLSVREIPYAVDIDPAKIGRYMPGTDIPIISPTEAKALNPRYYLILPYSYADEFIKKERAFLDEGGQFIIPLPIIRIVNKNNVYLEPDPRR